jgi:hypothetical protein
MRGGVHRGGACASMWRPRPAGGGKSDSESDFATVTVLASMECLVVVRPDRQRVAHAAEHHEHHMMSTAWCFCAAVARACEMPV